MARKHLQLFLTLTLSILLVAPACGGTDDSPSDAELTPTDAEYPDPPYGFGVGGVIQNHNFFDTEGNLIRLSDLYGQYKAIMINSSAGWCGACQGEMGLVKDIQSQYAPGELMVLITIFQDDAGRNADLEFVQAWEREFGLANLDNLKVVLDKNFALGAYFDQNATPMNMLVDGDNMEIAYKIVGADVRNFPSKIDLLVED